MTTSEAEPTLARVIAEIGNLEGENTPFRDFMDYEDLETFAVWHLEQIKAVRDAALTEAKNAIIDLASALTKAAKDAEGMAFAIGASKGVAAIRHLQEGGTS